MKRQHILWGSAGLAVLIAGALAAGVPTSTLLLLVVVLACPAMMLFMHGGHGGHDQHVAHAEQTDPVGHAGHDHDGQTSGRDETGSISAEPSGTR